MGAETVNAAVVDAGPLIHLTEVGGLHFLSIFDTLHIPNAVWTETVGRGRVLAGDVLGLGIVQRHNLFESAVAIFAQENDLEDLQDGEQECLCLCRQIGVTTLLTDDMAVRREAKRLMLTPVGSLGIVVRAYHLGRISLAEAERYMTDLYDVSSLFVTRAIVELAIEQLHSLTEQ